MTTPTPEHVQCLQALAFLTGQLHKRTRTTGHGESATVYEILCYYPEDEPQLEAALKFANDLIAGNKPALDQARLLIKKELAAELQTNIKAAVSPAGVHLEMGTGGWLKLTIPFQTEQPRRNIITP